VKLLPHEHASSEQTEEPVASQDHDSAYFFGKGSQLYLKQDYPAAAELYEKALDLEKRKRTLSKDYFRVLVDNLGMAYGLTGKWRPAKATFDYGVTQEPEYPMFHYNLACVHGEMSNMNDALAELRLFYKYKKNMIAGEDLPDPLKDDSFRFFVDNQTFVLALRDMQK
jgi:tetratricopeptide (TPR) repeat protein